MKALTPKVKKSAYSFKQLILEKRKKYKKESIIKNKEKIVNKFICDPEISKDLLSIYTDMAMNKNMNNEEKESLFNNFEDYYHILQYSLPSNENLKFYNALKCLDPQKISKYPEYEYLTLNDPINNFKNIYLKYSALVNEINDLNKVKINLENVKHYIDDMLKVYNVNLSGYYIPPREEYPTYVYNFYSFSFFQTLEKFREKKTKKLFTTNNKSNDKNYNEIEWIKINYHIGLFFKQVNQLFEKFEYKNIHKDLITLKIILYYFKNFEYTRDYHSNGETLKKVINCLDSEPITSDILRRFEFYRKNDKTPIKEEEWDSIGINENLYIKYPTDLRVKIKHFNKNILNLDDDNLLLALDEISIENLNVDGITKNSIVKFSPEIEQYSKKLLKSILSSKKYRESFLKYVKRFNSYKIIENLLKDIFIGGNSDLIFEEIWENIFFVPFLGKDFSSFNSRDQYSIFINCDPTFNFNITFQKIIPYYHCQLNTLFHEFTHKISLIIAANLEEDNFETIVIKDNKELEDLMDLQNIYFKKYNQNNKIYTYFDDFGDLMEVEMYGIRPRKFKTFSGLFCLDYNSYILNPNEFREICVGLYNFNNSIHESSKAQDKNVDKYNLEQILNGLLNSEIAKILYEYFYFGTELKNESFIEDGKPREISPNPLYNEEISINIDYCDKLA